MILVVSVCELYKPSEPIVSHMKTKKYFLNLLLFLFISNIYSQAVYNGSSTHKFTTSYGNIEIGPFNTSWAHIYTDRPKIIFNKDVYTTSNAFSSYDNDLVLKTSGTERFRINTLNGNVGIGITNPTAKLHVNGSIKGNISGGAIRVESDYGYIDVGPLNSSWAHIYTNMPKIIFNKDVYTTSNAFSSYNNDLVLKTSGTERFRINRTSGNIGIGTPTPDAKLTVKGNIHTQEVKVDLNGAVAPDYVFKEDYNLKSLAQVQAYIN